MGETTCRAACRARAGAEDRRAAVRCELKEGWDKRHTAEHALFGYLFKGDDAYRYEMITKVQGRVGEVGRRHVKCNVRGGRVGAQKTYGADSSRVRVLHHDDRRFAQKEDDVSKSVAETFRYGRYDSSRERYDADERYPIRYAIVRNDRSALPVRIIPGLARGLARFRIILTYRAHVSC